MLKRIITLSLLLVSLVSFSFFASAVAESVDIDPNLNNESTIYDLSSNYFVKEDDKTVVPNPNKSKLTGTTSPYTLIAENDYLELYLIEDTLNIAVYIKSTGYTFQTDTSYYQYNIEAYFTTGTLAEISSTIPTKGLYSTSLDKNVKPVLTYSDIENGFECHFDYTCLGIEYNLYVYLDDSRLVVYVPEDEIEENPYVVTKTEFKKDDDGNYIIGDDGRFVQITTST